MNWQSGNFDAYYYDNLDDKSTGAFPRLSRQGFNLIISNFQESDVRDFCCRVTIYYQVYAETDLKCTTLQYLPAASAPPFTVTVGGIGATAGSTANLSCSVSPSIPDTDYSLTWYRGGQKIYDYEPGFLNAGYGTKQQDYIFNEDKQTLGIKNFQGLDGWHGYICQVTRKSTGKSDTASTDIRLYELATLTVEGTLTFQESSTGTIPCTSSDDNLKDTRQLRWRKNGTLIYRNENRPGKTAEDSGLGPDAARYTRVDNNLKISDIRSSDAGLYTCEMENTSNQTGAASTPVTVTP